MGELRYVLYLNESKCITFACVNATLYDLQLIMFDYAIYETFGNNSFLFEPNFAFLSHIKDETRYLNARQDFVSVPKVYQCFDCMVINVDQQCASPFSAQRKFKHVLKGEDIEFNVQFNAAICHRRRRYHRLIYSDNSQYFHTVRFVSNFNLAFGSRLVVLLINELIKNGYEDDLIMNTTGEGKIDAVGKELDELQKLRSKYKIFDVLDAKMNHPRHVAMNKPFEDFPGLLLALILYTSGSCNHDMSLSLRNGDFGKWRVFSRSVESAVFILSKFNEFRNITLYSGLCDVYLDHDFDNNCNTNRALRATMKAPMSFTTDLDVATAFRGDQGTLFGVRFGNSSDYNFCMADVSWISMFPNEKEVLFVNTPLDLVRQTQYIFDYANKTQWISLTVDYNVVELFPKLKQQQFCLFYIWLCLFVTQHNNCDCYN